MLGFFRIGGAGRLDDVGALRLRCKGGAFAAPPSSKALTSWSGLFCFLLYDSTKFASISTKAVHRYYKIPYNACLITRGAYADSIQ
jgi:hypothetical protein